MSENSAKLKIEGLPLEVTEGQLEILLTNKRRQGGGKVKKIELNNNGATNVAVVTFEESEAVDIILGRGNTLNICNVSVSVKRCSISRAEKPVVASPRKGSKANSFANEDEKVASSDDSSDNLSLLKESRNKTVTKKKDNSSLKKSVSSSDINVKPPRKTSKTKLNTADEDDEVPSLNKTHNNNKLDYKRSKSVSDVSKKKLAPASRRDSDVNPQTTDDEQEPTLESSEDELLSEKAKNTKSKTASKKKQSSGSDEDPDKEHLEKPWEATIKCKLKDVHKSKDFYVYYFEDPKISQGQFYEDSLMLDGLNRTLYVTFHTRKAADATVQFRHKPESNLLKVEMAIEEDFKTDCNALSVHGFFCSTPEQKSELIDKITEQTEMEVIDLIQHDEPRSAIVVFSPDPCPDICKATWANVSCGGVRLIIAPVFKTSCVKLSGLNSMSADETVQRYMINTRRSAGGEFISFVRLSKTEALVVFKELESFEGVLNKEEHSLEGCQIQVSPYYSCLSQEIYKKQIEPILQLPMALIKVKEPHQSQRSRNVHRQTTQPPLQCRVVPVYSPPDIEPAPKNVFYNLKLCKFGKEFLTRQSDHLQGVMQSVNCKYDLSYKDSIGILTLRLDWPERILFRQVRSMLKDGLEALCKYLDTFRAASFVIKASSIHSFQTFCLERMKQEMPDGGLFFDHVDNLAVFISNRDDAWIRNYVNRMYQDFLASTQEPDGDDGPKPIVNMHKNKDDKVAPRHKDKRGKNLLAPHTSMEANKTDEAKDKELSHEELTVQIKVEELEEKDIILFQKTRFHEELAKLDKSIKVEFNSENTHAIIKGNDKSSLDKVQIELLKKSRQFISLDITSMFSSEQITVLSKIDVQENINRLFAERNYPAHLKCNNRVISLFFVRDVDDTILKGIVNSQVVIRQRPLDKDMILILHSEKGRKFLADLCEINDGVKVSSCLKFNEQEQSLQIIAPLQHVDLIIKKVDRFAEENRTSEKQILFSKGKQIFVMRFLSHEIKRIEDSLTQLGARITVQENCFEVKGLKDGVTQGEKLLSALSEKILTQDVALKYFGIKEYLQTREGKSLLTSVEDEKSCVIFSATDSQSEKVGITTFRGKQLQLSKPPSLIAEAKVGECTILFMQGDITCLDTDAIINPIDVSLKCHTGLGKVLISKGGFSIQNQIETSQALGIPGEVIETSAGSLDKCKKIIHVVCPVFANTEVEELAKACTACFQHIAHQNFNSLAIPAVGTGKVFKFLPVVACRILMKSLSQHFSAGSSSLRKIYICDTNGDYLKELIDRFKNCFDQDVSEIGQIQTSPIKGLTAKPVTAPPKPAVSRAARTSKDFRHIKVNLVTGEITKQQTDIIVVTVGKTVDLNKGGMTRNILKYGGDAVQQELTSNYPDGIQPGEFGKSSGGNLPNKSIYYVRLHHWRGNGEKHMSKLVYKLLESADQESATSMSIPAIGTGNLGYPADIAADVITDTICQFAKNNPKSSLRSVNLVVFHKDTDVLQAFNTVLLGGTAQGAGASSHDKSGGFRFQDSTKTGGGKSEMHFKSLKLTIKKGDITAERCDAIISGIRDTMNMSGSGAVCQALLKKCGSALQDECNDKVQEMAQNGFVMTSAPNLNCQKIYHVSMDRFSRSWDKCIVEVLTDAENQGFTSIAMPAFGTGARNADYHRIKKVLLSGLNHFASSHDKLRDVRMVIYSQEILDEFLGVSDSRKQPLHDREDVHDNPQQNIPEVSDQVTLKIYGDSYQKIVKATENLKDVFSKAFKEEKEKDKEIKRLDKRQVFRKCKIYLRFIV